MSNFSAAKNVKERKIVLLGVPRFTRLTIKDG